MSSYVLGTQSRVMQINPNYDNYHPVQRAHVSPEMRGPNYIDQQFLQLRKENQASSILKPVLKNAPALGYEPYNLNH